MPDPITLGQLEGFPAYVLTITLAANFPTGFTIPRRRKHGNNVLLVNPRYQQVAVFMLELNNRW